MLKRTIALLLILSLFSCITIYAYHNEEAHNLENASTANSSKTNVDNECTSSTELYPTVMPLSDKYLNWLYGASDEVLESSTPELLNHFLESNFIHEVLVYPFYLSSSDLNYEELDFNDSEIFKELITRADLSVTLVNYMKTGTNRDSMEFRKLLSQPQIIAKFEAEESLPMAYPNINGGELSLIPTSFVENPTLEDSIRSIEHNVVATITTADGEHEVDLQQAERELTAEEKAYLIGANDDPDSTLISDPSSLYNCHSYAWYRNSTSNPYWIGNIDEYLDDSTLIETNVPGVPLQVNDIIVYYEDIFHIIVTHSGIVDSISPNGEVMIRSKWGTGGLYLHSVNSIPKTYKGKYDGNDIIVVKYFRYHEYVNQPTKSHYHSGNQHHFEYADICQICKAVAPGTASWRVVPCRGPYCMLPWSLPNTEYEEY